MTRVLHFNIAGATAYAGVPARRYSKLLTKDAAVAVRAGMLVKRGANDSEVLLNDAATYADGLITNVEPVYQNGSEITNGVGVTQVLVTVLMDRREDVVVSSADTITAGQNVFAGDDGVIVGTGTVAVGKAVSDSQAQVDPDGVTRSYFLMTVDFGAINNTLANVVQ